jgi:hypothetical protein
MVYLLNFSSSSGETIMQAKKELETNNLASSAIKAFAEINKNIMNFLKVL